MDLFCEVRVADYTKYRMVSTSFPNLVPVHYGNMFSFPDCFNIVII